MNSRIKAAIETYIAQEKLPDSYFQTVEQWFIPVAEEILQALSSRTEPLVVGVSGCQGSGKSTLAGLLVVLLKEIMGVSSVSLSIDDFYLTHEERLDLSRDVHPLLATRGVPGTHDVELALSTIAALKQTGQVAIPRFDKSVDDRQPEEKWPRIEAPVDVIILEGWCLSIGPEDDQALAEPTNFLESSDDESGVWRRYVNQSIKESYLTLYDLVDYLVMLKAPAFEKVFDWRQQQEDKLLEEIEQQESRDTPLRVMNTGELQRFIQHYERITRHGLKTLPTKADVVFALSNEQTISARE